MGRIAKGGYIQNGRVHKYRNLIQDADEWVRAKAEFMRVFYRCKTHITIYPQSIELHAYRKAEGRKKEINIIYFLDIIENRK